jgi:hypothetical protein
MKFQIIYNLFAFYSKKLSASKQYSVDDGMSVGEFVEMRTGRRKRNNRRNPTTVALCLLQVPHNVTWD